MILNLQTQDYLISCSGAGASTTVDSVGITGFSRCPLSPMQARSLPAYGETRGGLSGA